MTPLRTVPVTGVDGLVAAGVDGGLVIRVWTEPDSREIVRARVLSFRGNEEPSTWATAAGRAALLDAVDRWISDQVEAAGRP